MKSLELRGLYPATITPFAEDFCVDSQSLVRHLEATASARGVSGLVVNGHAGEIISLSSAEREEIVRAAVGVKRAHQIIVAGIESFTLNGAIQEGLNAKRAGADALLVLPLFDLRIYRGLSQFEEPVVEFFAALDREVDIPMIVFLYPDKSGVAYPLRTLAKLAELKNVVGVKVSPSSMARYTDLWNTLSGKISVLAASDAPELLGMLLYGAHGSLIGIGVVGTEHWAQVVEDALNGRAEQARQTYNRVCIPLMRSLFENQEPSGPVGAVSCVKEALRLMGQIPSARVRPFVIEAGPGEKIRVAAGLREAGLLPGT